MATLTKYLCLDGGLRGYGYGVTPPPPPPPPVNTIFGFNTNEKDNFNQTIQGRLAMWSGRAPIVRRYHSGMLPATFAQTVTQCPEKRVSLSFKPDGSFSAASLAAGGGNARLLSWAQSIPAGWTVYLTYFHEVNDDIRGGNITAAQFKQAYAQFYPVIQSASLRAGVTIRVAPNFMAYRLSDTPTYFDDSWVPAHGTADLLTFDIYGNPGSNTSATGSNTYGKATGAGLGSTYPLPAQRSADMFAIIDRLGWSKHWGVLEVNSPKRTWDLTEGARSRWLVDDYEYFINRPTPPEVLILWEAPSGVNWDQEFKTQNPVNALRPYIEGSA